MEESSMNQTNFFCPLLSRNIDNPLCKNITYAAEGRISQAIVPEVNNWEKAKLICADCGNAYWNRNNMQMEEFETAED